MSQHSTYNIDNSIISSLDDSFFKENNREMQVEECFKTIDDRINYKIAEGLKRGTKLVFQKLNSHIQSKIKLLIDEEVDRRMLVHENKMHKQTKTTKSQSVTQRNVSDHLILPNEYKSQGSLNVNTPQKKDSVQELKVFETVDGIQTFGRQKVCSDRKLKNNEDGIDQNKNVFETQVADLAKPVASAQDTKTTTKVDKKVEKVKKSSPTQKLPKQTVNKVNTNNNNSSKDGIAKEKECNLLKESNSNSSESKKAWNSSTMTNVGEEKSKKGTKLKAKLSQDEAKEITQSFIQKNEDAVVAPAKRANAGSGNHKKSQSKFDAQMIQSTTIQQPSLEEPLADPKSDSSSGTGTPLNLEIQNIDSPKDTESEEYPERNDYNNDQNDAEMIEQPAPPLQEIDRIEIPQSLEIPDQAQNLDTESQQMVEQSILKAEDPLTTSILTIEDKLAINQGSFAIKPTAVETAPVPSVAQPAVPVNMAPEPVQQVTSGKSSTTTGSKESTTKKTTASKRESVNHRKKSPIKAPGKSNGTKHSRMATKTSIQDISNRESASASAGDDIKSKVAKKAARELIHEKDKVVAQVNEPNVATDNAAGDRCNSTLSLGIQDSKQEGVNQMGQNVEDGGFKGEQQQQKEQQKEQKTTKGNKTVRAGQSSHMHKKSNQESYGAALEEKYKTNPAKKQAASRASDAKHKLQRKQSLAMTNNFEPNNNQSSVTARKFAAPAANAADEHDKKNLNSTFQNHQTSMPNIKDKADAKDQNRNISKKRKRSYSPMMKQQSQIMGTQMTEELKTKTFKKLGL